jgi:hypothetical protein
MDGSYTVQSDDQDQEPSRHAIATTHNSVSSIADKHVTLRWRALVLSYTSPNIFSEDRPVQHRFSTWRRHAVDSAAQTKKRVILIKALLLADDRSITDPTITSETGRAR